jgi:hypothetical protein
VLLVVIALGCVLVWELVHHPEIQCFAVRSVLICHHR